MPQETKNRRAIAIFVKTPGLSPIKTRLASGIGEDKALEFYHLALDCVEELVSAVDAAPYWTIGEEDGLPHPRWKNFERLWTGGGDLGDRQHHIYATLRKSYEEVMLIGIDCPQLTPAEISAAFAELQNHNFVIGSAEDGGYTYLCSNKDIPKATWKAVEYSQSDTLEKLLNHLSGSHTLLQKHSDVDHAEDLEKALNEMPDAPSNAQQNLIDWIKALN